MERLLSNDEGTYLRQNLPLSDHKRIQSSADFQQVPHSVLPRKHEKISSQVCLAEPGMLLQIVHHVSDGGVAIVRRHVDLEPIARRQHGSFLNVWELAQLSITSFPRNIMVSSNKVGAPDEKRKAYISKVSMRIGEKIHERKHALAVSFHTER